MSEILSSILSDKKSLEKGNEKSSHGEEL